MDRFLEQEDFICYVRLRWSVPPLIHWADYDSLALSCAKTDAGSIRRNDMLVLDCWGIKERVESMGGELTVQSAPENGTAISWSFL